MKIKSVNFLFIALALIFFPITLVFAYYPLSKPTGFVSDNAAMLNLENKQALETKLSQFEKDTSNEIAIATINSLEGDTIENFAEKLFKEWGIGKTEKDNGVLVLISKNDKQMRIEVGYGLEGALTDAQSYWIIQNVMRPAFQKNDYDAGIAGAVDQIIAATKGEFVPSQNSNTSSKINVKLTENIIFFVFFAIIWLGAILARSKSWWAGGAIGVIIGIILIFVFSWIIGLISILILGPLGLLFDYIISKNYQKRKSQGLPPVWWAGGGFGGGGNSFGGFGRGSSGGGGSSGGW